LLKLLYNSIISVEIPTWFQTDTMGKDSMSNVVTPWLADTRNVILSMCA